MAFTILALAPGSVVLVEGYESATTRETLIFVLGHADDAKALQAFAQRAGANGCTLEPAAGFVMQLNPSPRSESRAHRFESEGIRLLPQASAVVVRGESFRLSPRQFALVAFLYRRAGTWVSRRDLFTEFFGAENGYDSSLVRTHILNIRRRLRHNHGVLKTDRLLGVMLVTTP